MRILTLEREIWQRGYPTQSDEIRGEYNFENKDGNLFENVKKCLSDNNVEFRLGTAGGGNQSRQPYLEKFVGKYVPSKTPVLDHIHSFGLYVGNHTELSGKQIIDLCKNLNNLQEKNDATKKIFTNPVRINRQVINSTA